MTDPLYGRPKPSHQILHQIALETVRKNQEKRKETEEKGREKEGKHSTGLICDWGMGKRRQKKKNINKAMPNDSAFPSISFGEKIRLLQFNRTKFAYCFGH